jgi:hypothetical protein
MFYHGLYNRTSLKFNDVVSCGMVMDFVRVDKFGVCLKPYG